MTEEVKILRGALKDTKRSYHESGAGDSHSPNDYPIELCRDIASTALAEADEVRDGPSEEDKARLIDCELFKGQPHFSSGDINWIISKLKQAWGME